MSLLGCAQNGVRNVAEVLRVWLFLTNFVVSLRAERICASGGAVLTKQKHISDMEENPNNMVEDAPAGAKKRSSNILPLVIAVLVCAAMAGAIVLMRGGCSNSATHKLKMAVTEANNSCPYDFGSGGSILSIKYDEDRNEVAMLIAINEEVMSAVMLKQNSANSKKQMRLNLSQSTCKQLLLDLANAGASYKVTFKGLQSGNTVDIPFTSEEIKEMSEREMSQAEIEELSFENWLFMQNNSCPQDIGDGMSMTKVVREGDKVIVYIQGAEKEYVRFFRTNDEYVDAAKSDMLSGLIEDKSIQLNFQMLTRNGMGLVYRFYHDDPKKCVDFAFTVDELHNALKTAKD